MSIFQNRAGQDAVTQRSLWAPLPRIDARFAAVLLIVASLGLALRLTGARGDLWLDEIWSLSLLRDVTSLDQIFWRINHDNNHFLNSVYLYFVGPDAGSVAQRGLSIALGTMTPLAAAFATARSGPRTQIATALLFAVSYPMVQYGSEARGYVGLVLFTLLAVALLERRMEGRGGLAFALVVLAGLLSHMTMVGTIAILVAWAAWQTWDQTKSLAGIDRRIGSVFAPAFYSVMPLMIVVIAGASLFGFAVGGYAEFTMASFAEGYGGMIRALLGFPDWIGNWPAIAGAVLAVTVTARMVDDPRSSLYIIGIVGLPLAMMAAHLPNLVFPRYFLVSGTLLLLWAGEMIGRGLEARGARRAGACLALAAVLAGNGLSLRTFMEHGRGAYAGPVAMMVAEGDTTYGTNHVLRTAMVVDHFARGLPHSATAVATPSEMCMARPQWFILDSDNPAPETLSPDRNCDLRYRQVAAYDYWGLSGIRWVLYRRQD